MCHHCGHAEPVPARLHRVPLDGDRPPGRGHPAARGRARRGARAGAGLPARRRRGPPQARHRGRAGARSSRAPRACSWERRWSPRGTTSPRSSWRSSRTPTPTLRFPDFRAEERTFALVSQLAGRSGRGPARRARARADAGARVAVPAPRRAPRRRGLPRRRRSSGAGCCGYPPFSRPGAGRHRPPPTRRPPSARPRASGRRSSRHQASSCSARRRCSASRTATAACCLMKARRCERSWTCEAIGAAVQRRGGGARLRGVSFAVDVDPSSPATVDSNPR